MSAGALAPDGTLVAMTEVMVNERGAVARLPERHAGRAGAPRPPARPGDQARQPPAAPGGLARLRILLTGNAGVNAPMNAVNEALGYREVERCVEMQKDV